MPESEQEDVALEAETVRLLGRGEKLKAVKLYKATTGATLLESKRAVEAMAVRHGITLERAGCRGVLILLLVILIAIAVVAVIGDV